SKNYLHAQGWRTFYRLRVGERTPVFRLAGSNLSVVTWYLRMDGARGELPNWGIVRLELPQRYFEGELSSSFDCIDRLSAIAYLYRTPDRTYGRAPVTILPI